MVLCVDLTLVLSLVLGANVPDPENPVVGLLWMDCLESRVSGEGVTTGADDVEALVSNPRHLKNNNCSSSSGTQCKILGFLQNAPHE